MSGFYVYCKHLTSATLLVPRSWLPRLFQQPRGTELAKLRSKNIFVEANYKGFAYL